MLDLAEHEGTVEHRGRALGDGDRLLGATDVAADDHELVAAKARHGVAGAQRLVQAGRELEQQVVAGAVAQAVVDELEVVDVEEEDRHPGLAAVRLGQCDREAVDEERAVRQPGEGIVQSLMADVGLGSAALCGLGQQVGDRVHEVELVLSERAPVGRLDREDAERRAAAVDRHADGARRSGVVHELGERQAGLGRPVLDDQRLGAEERRA
jgi:hypothetical protein